MKIWTRIRTACEDLSPDCRAAVRTQSEALDHPLPAARKVGLWVHLLICKWCRRYSKQVRLLHQAAHDHPEQLTGEAPAKLSAAARERIKQRLQGVK